MLFVLTALTASRIVRPHRLVPVQYPYLVNENEEYFDDYYLSQLDYDESNKGKLKKFAQKVEKAADAAERGIKVAKTAHKIYKWGKRFFQEAEENSFDQPIEYQYYENEYDDEDDLNDYFLSQLEDEGENKIKAKKLAKAAKTGYKLWKIGRLFLEEAESNKDKGKKFVKGAKKAYKAAKTAHKIYKIGKRFFQEAEENSLVQPIHLYRGPLASYRFSTSRYPIRHPKVF
ncbi:hypothetical protein TVAG_328990 [Trichomonas vaginalis G3]|uniref:Uncharacterized protein n=1 Tax=Trichomonas vaginalis (strain ATCC PRA-98 / G3) TaxID=412133 RepID=A2EW40_TRIV3|nr:hypothetical protein TVAGG3_0687040 [Trichomonas vaginalis G3]EAY03126.1 hypothetical protein TVAG_328990 [Trichomonas vaginalis G3]KAI5508297.1 hypothetical protein TVAGG3_0687040 [Trichomonas vaginalis G3]|eukprot:XP_001315349.1 hypothetical protein [Trichomonas vaginalis G3]